MNSIVQKVIANGDGRVCAHCKLLQFHIRKCLLNTKPPFDRPTRKLRIATREEKFHFDCEGKKFFISRDDIRFNENCFSLPLSLLLAYSLPYILSYFSDSESSLICNRQTRTARI